MPQEPRLNQGLWVRLESKAFNDWRGRFQEIWVLTGPWYSEEDRRLDNCDVRIPEGYWKVFIDEDPERGELRAIGILVAQDDLGDPAEHVVTIDHIESVTGLDLFPGLPPECEAELEASEADDDWWEGGRVTGDDRKPVQVAEATSPKPQPERLNQPEDEEPEKSEGSLSHWITTSSGIRHNSNCRWFENSNGRLCGPNEGRACKRCGG